MFKSSRGLDEKLTGVLIAAWSLVLLVATVDTFCGNVSPAPSVAQAQLAQQQAEPASSRGPVKVAAAH